MSNQVALKLAFARAQKIASEAVSITDSKVMFIPAHTVLYAERLIDELKTNNQHLQEVHNSFPSVLKAATKNHVEAIRRLRERLLLAGVSSEEISRIMHG